MFQSLSFELPPDTVLVNLIKPPWLKKYLLASAFAKDTSSTKVISPFQLPLLLDDAVAIACCPPATVNLFVLMLSANASY